MNQLPSLPAFTERQSRIIALTESQGFVTIERLADEFGVSAQTVRRDIIALAEAGRLQRFHGGAGAIGETETLRLDHSQKERVAIDGKLAVARQACARVPNGASLYLDVGTTIEYTAKQLNARSGLKVFTNSLRAALAFDPGRHEVTVLGGRMAGKDGSLVGEEIVMMLTGLTLDFALIACSAIDERGRVMDFDMSKIAVKKAAMAAAENSLLLATPSKFGRTALSTVAALDDFTHVLTGQKDEEAARLT
ncbi:DeoR/GlpR family DNA-binding transcription regulator [uncultured Roseibium sp.]|uniref:DeoR/GlpR family DNA-binding transcription regulator n=1 Tax=uncultured Roseibium sp. TaxID=1936171 RepID=UPI002591B138|nr:DeoR/GlpR family DNA-binding transcription regulator [uncultured Roseibium sp.]